MNGRSSSNSSQRRLQRYQWLRILGRATRTPRGAVGLTLLLLVVAIAAIGPLVSPYQPNELLALPFGHASSANVLGADTLGRDVLSRVLNGGWVLLMMAAAATALGVSAGTVAGVTAAYLRGRWDGLIMRTVDVVLAFPQMVFALLLVSVFGPKLWLIVIAVGMSHAPQVARVVRSATLEISERDYVKAVELWGVKSRVVMNREILPNIISPLMVEVGLRLTYSVVIISGLAFLGFGQPPPAPNWGYMITENLEGAQGNLWTVAVPALLIALLTVGSNTFTDAVARVAIGVDRKPDQVAQVNGVQLEGNVA
jgi:peptide/nickel transport system permease protein